MTKQQQTRRSKLLVEPSVQMAVAMRLVSLWAGTLVVTAAISVVMAYFREPTGNLLAHLSDFKHWMPSFLAFVAILPLAVLDLVRFSHRFAGPVHRLRNEMQRLADGQPMQKLKFRKKDYWLSLADDFNRVVARVESSQEQRRESTEEPQPIGAPQ